MPVCLLPKPFTSKFGWFWCCGLALIPASSVSGANSNVPQTWNAPTPSGPAPNTAIKYLTFPARQQRFHAGLILVDGKLLESTGQEGSSSLRSVELETGKILKKVDVPRALLC